MRPLLALLACLALVAGEAAPLPPATQKLVDDAVAVAIKSKQTYDQATAKEQAKLIAALTREQDRETKKGNLDAAVAIKQLITDVQLGLLKTRAEAGDDLLGDAAAIKTQPAVAATGSPAELATDCQVPAGSYRGDPPPEELAEFIKRAVTLRVPRDDATHYQFAATTPGMVAVLTGNRRRYQDQWSELEKAGFHRLEGGGEDYAWFVATLRPGDRFTVANADGKMWTEVLAARIKPAR